MNRYILMRLVLIVPTIIGAGILVFIWLRLSPGDPCTEKFQELGELLDPEFLETCRSRLGIDKPVHVQFWLFLKGLLTLDLGDSMVTGRSVTSELLSRFGVSAQIALMSIVTVSLIAVPLGLVCAYKQNSWIDNLIRTVCVFGMSMPSFWLGLLIILGLLWISQSLTGTPWMPPISYVSPFKDPATNLSMVFWPVLVVTFRYTAIVVRITRSTALEILREDFVRTAHAKGLPVKLVKRRHILRNALPPVLTVVGIEFGFVLSGLVVTEQVFNINGLGQLLVDSLESMDYSMLEALIMFSVVLVSSINLLCDLAYAWIDPRIRYR